MTTPVEGDSAGVRDYHQGLAQHLLDLIRKATSGSTSVAVPTGTATQTPKKQSVTPPPPANPRQHSGSSLESNSRVSSGQTTESRRSNADHHTTTDAEEDAGDHVATLQKGARRGSDDSEGLDRAEGDDECTSSGPYDLTARPDSHPARFSPLPTFHIASDEHEHESTQIAESSASGALRYARSPQPAGQSPISPRQESSPKTGATARLPRPRYVTHPSSHAETLTREAEHRKAWETDGKRVWRNIPAGFELKLEKKPRSGSNESSSVDLSGAQSIHSGISGAGPGTAMRPDDVFVPDLLDVEAKDCEMVSSNEHTNRDTASEISKPEIQSDSSLSMSVAKPTVKRTSTLQRRQAMVEAQAKAEAHARAQVQEQTKLHPATQQTSDDSTHLDRTLRSEKREAVSGTERAQSEDEQEEYLRKRQMRLRKKEYVLKKRIGSWWQDVLESHGGHLNGYHRDNFHRDGEMPEIEPHIPSPKLDSSMLRFPPLPSATSLLEDSDGSSTVLRLPSLQLIEDGRRHKSLTFAPPHRGESDVDLLIRLTEMSRVSSASGSGAARGVSLGPGPGSGVDRTIFPLSPPRLLP